MFKAIRTLWLKTSLKKKLGVFALMLVFVIGVSIIFNIVVLNFVVGDFNVILDENSRCHDFQEAMELEIGAFQAYVRDRSEEKREAYILSCVRTERCIRFLPFEYEKIGSERYARTWNIKNGYENYSIKRDKVLEMDGQEETFISELYAVYDMQAYMQTYARRLVQVTLKAENPKIRYRI